MYCPIPTVSRHILAQGKVRSVARRFWDICFASCPRFALATDMLKASPPHPNQQKMFKRDECFDLLDSRKLSPGEVLAAEEHLHHGWLKLRFVHLGIRGTLAGPIVCGVQTKSWFEHIWTKAMLQCPCMSRIFCKHSSNLKPYTTNDKQGGLGEQQILAKQKNWGNETRIEKHAHSWEIHRLVCLLYVLASNLLDKIPRFAASKQIVSTKLCGFPNISGTS